MSRTALVTGGSGFVGGRLIERLVRDGWTVRALARSDGAAGKVEAAGAEPVRGDLGDPAALERGARGAEVAFHAAAKVEDWGDIADFRRVNVEGTKAVLDACRAAGVRRVVHVGTEAALLHGQPLVMADERTPLAFHSRSPYSATKAEAEAVVVAAPGIETVVGPAAVRVGPGRHHARAGDDRAGPQRALPLDRRRPPPDVDDPPRQLRRGAGPGGRPRHVRAPRTSSPTATRSRSATS